MATRISRAVVLGLAMAATAGGCAKAAAPPNAPTPPDKRGVTQTPLTPAETELLRGSEPAWRAARKTHPLHFQGVFSAKRDDGRITVIVTEPPPHARPAEVRRMLAAQAIKVQSWPIGFNGSVSDLVAVIESGPDGEGEGALNERLAALHQYLFHSTYRAQVYDAFAKPDEGALELDLALPLGAIPTWLKDPQRRFVSLTGEEVGSQELARSAKAGVYRAQDIGLTAWLIKDRGALCSALPEMRSFTLESDLLLGAMQVPSGVLVVGRARVASLERLPPLRTEVLLGLTAADSNELGQSYQRNNFFAGKLKDGRDWAPILLSADLVNTEFGGLLNITDQLLKGWSLNGGVTYEAFDYPKPSSWAAAKPLSDELGASSVTFNWNTSGAMTQLELADARVMVNPRTGALPIAYIPEGMADGSAQVADIEERNQSFFATQNDPNLVRVVGYTTFYQIAQALRLGAGKACANMPRKGTETRSKAETFLEDLLVKIMDGTSAPPLTEARDDAAKRVVEHINKSVGSVEEQLGPEGKRDFIHYLAGVSGHYTVKQPRQDLLDFGQQVASAMAGLAIEGHFEKLFDRDAVQQEFTRLAAGEPCGYICTPTVVVSRVPKTVQRIERDGRVWEVTTTGTGGHNLRNVPGKLRVDENAAGARVDSSRTFDFQASVPEAGLWIDPKVFQRVQKAVQDRRMSTADARVALDEASASPVAAPTLRVPSGSHPGVGFDVPRAPRPAVKPPAFEVEYRGQPGSMYVARSPEGRALDGGSTRGMLDALASEMRGLRAAKRPMLLDLQGFSEPRAKNFVSEVVQRMTGDARVPRVVFVSNKSGRMSRFRTWLDGFRGNPRVQVTQVSGAGGSSTYQVTLPEAQLGLLVRLHGRLGQKAAPLADRIRALFRSQQEQALVERLDGLCEELNLAAEVSVTELGAPRDVQVRLTPQQPRRGQPPRRTAALAGDAAHPSGT